MVLRFRLSKLLLAASVAAWLLAVCWGIKQLNDYSFRPGASGDDTFAWPEASALTRASRGCTLIVALHPDCPCSRATVSELEQIVSRGPESLTVYAVFSPGSPDPADRSDLPARVARLPRVTTVHDAQELRRFSFFTSGEIRLYNPAGRLLFHGGITASRGHVGENLGATAVVRLARGEASPELPRTTPVFGCALFER